MRESAPRFLPQRAGKAMAWQTLQLGGVNLIYVGWIVILGRLLAPDDLGLFAGALAAGAVGGVVAFGVIAAVDRHADIGVASTLARLFPRLRPLVEAAGFEPSSPIPRDRPDAEAR